MRAELLELKLDEDVLKAECYYVIVLKTKYYYVIVLKTEYYYVIDLKTESWIVIVLKTECYYVIVLRPNVCFKDQIFLSLFQRPYIVILFVYETQWGLSY